MTFILLHKALRQIQSLKALSLLLKDERDEDNKEDGEVVWRTEGRKKEREREGGQCGEALGKGRSEREYRKSM